jgi:hypothetical protein
MQKPELDCEFDGALIARAEKTVEKARHSQGLEIDVHASV